jgi:hypothetical protein
VRSKRNELIPIPDYIPSLLVKGSPNHNVFSNSIKPYGNSYSKAVFRYFKHLKSEIDDGSFYSCRRSRALGIFK